MATPNLCIIQVTYTGEPEGLVENKSKMCVLTPIGLRIDRLSNTSLRQGRNRHQLSIVATGQTPNMPEGCAGVELGYRVSPLSDRPERSEAAPSLGALTHQGNSPFRFRISACAATFGRSEGLSERVACRAPHFPRKNFRGLVPRCHANKAVSTHHKPHVMAVFDAGHSVAETSSSTNRRLRGRRLRHRRAACGMHFFWCEARGNPSWEPRWPTCADDSPFVTHLSCCRGHAYTTSPVKEPGGRPRGNF